MNQKIENLLLQELSILHLVVDCEVIHNRTKELPKKLKEARLSWIISKVKELRQKIQQAPSLESICEEVK